MSLQFYNLLFASLIVLTSVPGVAHAKNQTCKTISTEWITIDTYMTTKKINHKISSPRGRRYDLANGIWFGQKRISAKKKTLSNDTIKSVIGFGSLKIRKADKGKDFRICHEIVDLIQDDPQ